MENIGKKSQKKTTSDQFELLCKEMKNHPELASNKQLFGGNKNKCDTSLAEITNKLNSLGPQTRDAVEWKKVWSDLKRRTKKKVSLNHQLLTGTGGRPFQSDPLSPLKEMVDDAINIRSAAVPPGEVFGLIMDEEAINTDTETPSSSKPTGRRTQKRQADSTMNLLREQVNQQKKLIDKINDIHETLKNNTDALQKLASATEKIAELPDNFFNYITSD